MSGAKREAASGERPSLFEGTAMTPPDHPGRLYLLQPHPGLELYCGRTGDGRQFLLGPRDAWEYYVVFFDADGKYLGWHVPCVPRNSLPPLPPPLPREEALARMRELSEAGRRRDEAVFQAYFAALQRETGGCQLGPIRIQPFVVEDADFDMGAWDLPGYLQAIVDNPEKERQELGEDEFERFQTLLREWIERGDYVLAWGNLHDVSRDGEVVFS
jgi:hypothetical protein